jgi:hypothetical protein
MSLLNSEAPDMSIQRVSGYGQHAGSTSSVAFAAPQGFRTQEVDHLIRHIVERAVVYRILAVVLFMGYVNAYLSVIIY